MIGIYIITNLINNKVYIGQSEDIKRRWKEHKRHWKLDTNENVVLYKAFRKYGIQNFSFKVIQECSINELSELEIKYIKLYNSCITFNNCNGYNMTEGGEINAHLVGIKNGKAKMKEKDVYEIRERYKNKEYKEIVYQDFSQITSKSNFSDIWTGRTWKHIHYDVYTEENKLFHKNYCDRTKPKNYQKLSDIDILKIRDLKNDGLTRNEVYCLYKNIIKENTFYDIWMGNTFKHIQSNHKINYIKYSKKVNQDGINNPNSNLTKEEIIDIRTKKKNSIRNKDAYNEYKDKIYKTTFNNIWNYKTYKDITVD